MAIRWRVAISAASMLTPCSANHRLTASSRPSPSGAVTVTRVRPDPLLTVVTEARPRRR